LYLSAEEATLVTDALKPPDNGQERWTLSLLAERAKMVLGRRVCHAALSQLLRLNNITPYGMRQKAKKTGSHQALSIKA